MPPLAARSNGADGEAVSFAFAEGADAAAVVANLRRKLPRDDYAAVLVFFSPDFNADALAAAMLAAFGSVRVFGCTTAGELGPEGIGDGGAVAMAFAGRDFLIAPYRIENAQAFAFESVRDGVRETREKLSVLEGADALGRNRFGLLLVDGLCLQEEALISAIGGSLDDMQVVGGSAGDGATFGETFVLFDGKAQRHAAVLLLISTKLPVRLFRCNSFEPTAVKLVVTDADLEKRVVREFNAEPAASEYARIVGMPVSELNAHVFAAYPVIVRVGGDYYARSIQRANEDGSLTFFCAIDEGLVLTAAGRLDTLGVVEQMFRDTEAELGEVGAYLGFDCIHRRLDAEQRQILRDMEELYRSHRVIGFNTYGEQYASMHLNQTFSGVAFGRRKAS